MFGEILLVLLPQEMQLERAQNLSRDIFRNSFRECKIRNTQEFSLCGGSSLTTPELESAIPGDCILHPAVSVDNPTQPP